MKKVYKLLVIILTLILLTLSVQAYDNLKSDISKGDKYKDLKMDTLSIDKNKNEIENSIDNALTEDNALFGSNSIFPDDTDGYYKIDEIHSSFANYNYAIFSDFLKQATLKEIWEVVLIKNKKAIGYANVALKKDVWTFASSGVIPSDASNGKAEVAQCLDFICDVNRIEKALSSGGISDPDSIRLMRIGYSFHIDFLYVQKDNQEYAIPMAWRPDFYNINNFTVYKMDDFINLIKPLYKNGDTQKDNLLFGGMNYIKENPFNAILILSIFLFFLLAAIILILKRKKYLNKNVT